MWIDSASNIDMLAYKPFAELLYRIIHNERMNPLTIGLYGSWGAGKSTVLKLTEDIISEKRSEGSKKIECISINAWMLESYDDAKCALMESLLKSMEECGSAKSEIKGLFKRVDCLRLGAAAVKKGIPLALSLATGNPMPFMINLSDSIINKLKSEDGIQDIYDGVSKFTNEYIKPKDGNSESIVENVRMFKKEFQEVIESLGVDNLVVMIDDLDRCTPDKIIDTLEAIKLFLAVPRITFIIAVDERVIKYSIKSRYPMIDNDSVDISKDYIEKIIQLPVNIPELSEVDIMNYMYLLANELYMDKTTFESLIEGLYKDGVFYTGSRITESKVLGIVGTEVLTDGSIKNVKGYRQFIDVVWKTSGVVSGVLKGNPRQAKRFLNTFLVRKNMAEIYYGINNDVNIEILAKLLVLEYIDVDLFKKLNQWNNIADGGEIVELRELCELVIKGEDIPPKYGLWNNDKIKRWLESEPQKIYEKDLSKYFYLCRESLSGEVDNIENLNREKKEILNKIINSPVGTDKIEILKLNNIQKDSANKILKVLVKMFKDKRGKLSNIGIIYQNFENWRHEILEHIKTYSAGDVNIRSVGYLSVIYKTTPQEMERILEVWLDKKIVNETAINTIKGVKNNGDI